MSGPSVRIERSGANQSGARRMMAEVPDHTNIEFDDPEFADVVADYAARLPGPQPFDRSDGRKAATGSSPADLADAFLEKTGFRYASWRGDLYRYTGTHYAQVIDGDLRANVLRFLRDGKNRERAKVRLVSDVVANIHARCHLPAQVEPPALLVDGGAVAELGNLIPMKNGILDINAYLRGQDALLPHSPDRFTISALPFAFDPKAAEPEEWHKFLDSLLDDDLESRDTLQEIFGYLISGTTHLQKIFLIIGPKRSGKGTIARVVIELLGGENVAAPTLATLERPFGLQALIGKRAAIIADARLGGRADQTAVAERLLTISGEDAVTVDRKHLVSWTGRMLVRFLLLSNELPRVADASGALASRFIVLTLTQSFLGREDHELADRLLKELPGIGLWALKGLQRLNNRGRFVQPSSAAEAIRDLEDLGSPISAFLRDQCEVGAGGMIDCDRLFEAWQEWCDKSGRTHTGSLQTFGRDLRAACPGLKTVQIRQHGKRNRLYEGIGLRDTGGVT